MVFGRDGSLFVSSGDGSNYVGVDHRALRAQNLDSLAGKILRIDPITGTGLPDNPFYNASNPNSNRSKVWARGLRNPFRFTVNPDPTGEPFIGDVGWNNWEEINTGKGANFGWPCYEGGTRRPGDRSESGDTTSLSSSAYREQQPHDERGVRPALQPGPRRGEGSGLHLRPQRQGGASVHGGAFYSGTSYPASTRARCSSPTTTTAWIRYLTFDAQGRATEVTTSAPIRSSGPVQLITGPDTNIYWMRYDGNGGEVRRIRYVGAGNTPPVVEITATPTIGITPLSVAFNSDQSYDPDAQPLSYHWDFSDGTTSTAQNPTPHVHASGRLRRHAHGHRDDVTIRDARASTCASPSAATRRSRRSRQPADGVDLPRRRHHLVLGPTATAGGTPLPASSMTWQLRNHHNQHVHFATLRLRGRPRQPEPQPGLVRRR